MDILTLLVVIPVLTVLVLMFTKTSHQARLVSVVGMGIQLIHSIYILFTYRAARAAGDTAEMLFMKNVPWFKEFNIGYIIGVDGISVAMILLTAIITLAGVLISWSIKDLTKEFFISLLILATGVFGFFISLDLFTMFLFYEIAVIPMYLLIGIWGTGPKEYSAMKLTLMLMGASALLLVGILGIYFNSAPAGGEYTYNILEIAKVNIPLTAQLFFYPMTFIGFGVLGALFPFHTWSPDGHASAPTAVSMLHAGVLMKLGGYGILRVSMYLMPSGAQEWAWVFIILTAIGVIYGALGAVRQTDLKYINAYSSVSHLALVLFALLMMDKTSWNGSVLQMISHGLITALFFALIGMIYERTHTRDVYKMGGLMKILPFISAMYVIVGLASLGLPGLSGFVAEMTIFVGAFSHPEPFYRATTVIAVASIVVTAVYILRVVGLMLMGPVKNEEFEHLPPARWYEKAGTILLLVSILGVGLAPLWLSDMILESLAPVLERMAAIK